MRSSWKTEEAASLVEDRKQSGCLVRRNLCRQESKPKPGSSIKGSDFAPYEKSAGHDDQGIARQEISEFKRSANRQRKSGPRSPKRGRGEGGERDGEK